MPMYIWLVISTIPQPWLIYKKRHVFYNLEENTMMVSAFGYTAVNLALQEVLIPSLVYGTTGRSNGNLRTIPADSGRKYTTTL